MTLALLAAVFAAAFHSDFSGGLDGWSQPPAPAVCEALVHEGRAAALLRVPADAAVGFPAMKHSLPAAPGDRIRARAQAWPVDVRGGYGAYISVSYYGEDGARISYDQSAPAQTMNQWNPLSLSGIAPQGTVRMDFFLLLNGHGDAYFADAALESSPAPAQPPFEGEAVLTVSDSPLSQSLIGFGFEDDGWFYDEVNARQGVTAEDATLREARIDGLSPDWVRMFFWYRDWNPSMDGETFTWDNEAMRSKYRTLEQYQQLGTEVTLCGVEWSIDSPFASPEKLAQAWAALAEHLIRDKGFTCVKQWTLTNEPNLSYVRHGGTWETYVETHQRTHEAFERLGLDIRIVGSDDTNGGLPWFEQCIADERYFSLVDVMASHVYLRADARDLAELFYAERLAPLAGRRPFVVAEFGFQDARADGPMINPVMEEDLYATWALRFAFEGLNAGASGFSIWCLHEVFYPFDARMGYGLWNYKDRDWSLRPIYQAWKLLLDHTQRGDAVYPVVSSHPGKITGTRVGEGVFWVNDSGKPARIRIVRPEGTEIGTVETSPPGAYGWLPMPG